ncbi:phospho-sugar mutase [Fusibacter bizertensis]|uniref:Phosphoglucomutase n=1 Tax=Fusibacter bizertensis TaxID=1488331 RepID=A0ABT6NDR3_9FIRM|nr:phospho-sugar mutase [Fusibacter bizertensis]MDH8678570.1 phospho-sugar mutase [Fusibacter bizertensis]
MNAQEHYIQWLNNEYFDEAFRAELASIKNQPLEIEDRFYKDLEFGTAGMRGIIGAGRNRINEYIIRKATQGFVNFLLERKQKSLGNKVDQSVVIAYDSRRKSYEFALETAKVMAANGIMAYLFDEVRTTPELSFAVRELNCMGGVMVTASHNPPEYNGYKVYDETGCQLVPHLADALVDHVEKITDFSMVKTMGRKEAVQAKLLKIINEEVDLPYIEMVKKVSIRPELLKSSNLKVVYTPLHGTGGHTISRVLKEMSFSNLIPVEEQMAPDGEFPTCKQPNPESVEAFEQALKTAEKFDADLIIATDPDCDRIGIMIKDGNRFKALNGNQVGSLFVEYVLSSKTGLTKSHYIVNTIVSSDLAKAQAEFYGVATKKTLTGFKFIGEQIELDQFHFVMGYEESYGYLFDPHVRDKDAVMGTLMAIEMAEYYKKQGISLSQLLDNIYRRHGYFVDETISKSFEGKEGGSLMKEIMNKFRTQSEDIFQYEEKIDYLLDETGLPKSDVLKFYFDNHSWMVLRPSGTEPKLKVYFSICDDEYDKAKQKLEYFKTLMIEKVLA